MSDDREMRPEGGQESPDAKRTEALPKSNTQTDRPIEIGGRKGPDPTRFGDWEKAGRCIDF